MLVNTMPADLPPTTAYTYAVELSTDESLLVGARSVRFSEPVAVYVENFVGAPVGSVVPNGYYDRDKGVWVAEVDGRVVKVLSTAGGIASLDITGDGTADDDEALTMLGITQAERGHLAALYSQGSELWRVSLEHFSLHDFNFPARFPPDAKEPPDQDNDDPIDGDKHTGSEGCGSEGQLKHASTVSCYNQSVSEDLPLAGGPFGLHYDSLRSQDPAGPGTKLKIKLREGAEGAKRIELRIQSVGGLNRIARG